MRQSEILNLRVQDVDLRSRIARLTDTKNNTARTVPLSAAATAALKNAIDNPIRQFCEQTNTWTILQGPLEMSESIQFREIDGAELIDIYRQMELILGGDSRSSSIQRLAFDRTLIEPPKN